MDEINDHIVVKQVKQGDVAAFAQLVSKYQNMAYTLALSITKNSEDAEEVAQDAFVKVFKKINTFKGKSKFSTWLYQIIYRTALSKVRIKKHIHQSINEQHEQHTSLPSYENNSLEDDDKKKWLNIAIGQLSEDEAFLLILYYYKELSIEELVETSGLSASNVKVKLHRARKNLHQKLQKLMNGKAKSLIEN